MPHPTREVVEAVMLEYLRRTTATSFDPAKIEGLLCEKLVEIGALPIIGCSMPSITMKMNGYYANCRVYGTIDYGEMNVAIDASGAVIK